MVCACVETDWVLVHDAARPLAAACRSGYISVCHRSGEDGAILAIPVKDTMKRADISNRIELTVERAGISGMR